MRPEVDTGGALVDWPGTDLVVSINSAESAPPFKGKIGTGTCLNLFFEADAYDFRVGWNLMTTVPSYFFITILPLTFVLFAMIGNRRLA